MIVSHAYRFVLVTPPKTASTSLHRFLSQRPFCEQPWSPDRQDQHSAAIPGDCREYLMVTCWRHPLDREISLWAHSQSAASRKYDWTEPMTFREFVRDFQPTAKPFYSWSQAAWLGDTRIEVLLHFNELSREIVTLEPVAAARRAGYHLRPLKRLNGTQHASARDLYTDELRELVLDRFAEDLGLPAKVRGRHGLPRDHTRD